LGVTKATVTNVYGAFWIAAGANHFFNTPFDVSIMPPYLPWYLALIYISGVAEIGLERCCCFSGGRCWPDGD
jgi:uncharacterized membrane protein